MEIRPMVAPDLKWGFLETLSVLREVNLSPDEAILVFQRRLRDRVLTYVAVDEGQVVGTVSLILEQKFLHGGGVVGHIEDLAVHREYQHRGIGTSLMQYAVQVCHDNDCYKLILDCSSAVAPFYTRLGFKRWQQSLRLDLDTEVVAAGRGHREARHSAEHN